MTFLTRAIGPSSQVFAIPELVALVCSDLERPDCARLMRVSSCLFNHAMPFVWGEVTGMVHLLELLPGVMLERRSRNGRYSDPNELTEEVVIHLPRLSSLGRLRLYAPFVRTLEVLELPHRFYKTEGNLSASLSTLPKSGLLPNLRYLTLTDTCETVNQDHIDWISLFLCRTLQSVRVLSWYPSKRLWLPLDQFPSALSEIIQKCPDLEVLEVSPRSTISQREPGVYIPPEGSRESRQLGSFTVPHWCSPSSSSCFQTLRQLTGSTSFLQPGVFSFIGSLPALESLILHDSVPAASRTPLGLGPDITFPALKHLELHHLDARLTMHLCGLKQLVGSLTSAKIRFPFFQKGEWNIIQCDPPQVVLSALSLFAPHLEDLAIHLPSGSHKISLSHSTIEAFRRLSLRSLMFSDVCLAPDVGWSDVLAALPKVEVLRLRCSLGCQDLEEFSQRLPRLRHLEVQAIDFKAAEVSREGNYPPKIVPNGTPLCLASGLYIHDLENYNVLDRVARYLSRMWLRIMCVSREWETPANIRSIDALNDRMSTLQGIKCGTGHLVN